ncbi:MAG TPA: DUF559 domain-containing protein [Micromonosporaceae bacterium]|nr:DUF559 domain-containing protein [Micromonosporaceae bacterium]
MPRPPLAPPPTLLTSPFRAADAVARGLISRRQLAGRSWRRLFRDVYVHVETPVDAYTLCRAAALLLPAGGTLSHAAAAYLWTADLPPPDIEATVPASATLRSAPRLLVRHAHVAPAEVARRSGMPVTSPLRTAFDLARHRPLTEALVAVDLLLFRRLVTLDALSRLTADRAGWPHIRQVRRVVALAAPEAESPMETRARLVMIWGGLPPPALQYEVYDASGRFVARLDLAYPWLRIGIEYDGDQHRERATFQRDAVRLNRLRLCGWTVLRFTADDVLRHPDRMVAQIRQAIAAALG